MTMYVQCMTMLSFRCDAQTVATVDRWAADLGTDRSHLLREAVRLHLNRLAAEHDAGVWAQVPLDEGEQALVAIADWGPSEDWTDWADAQG